MTVLGADALVIMALAMAPGDRVVVHGTVATSWDGARFPASALFDAEAGGLRVAENGAFVATGAQGAACAAAGVSSPCLVPRLEELAHARLLTVEELRRTLSGSVVLELTPAPVPVSRTPLVLSVIAICAAIAGACAAALAFARRLRVRYEATAMGAVHSAAHAARRATGNDPTLTALRADVERMVSEAREVARACQECEAALARPHGDFPAELAERERLQNDLLTARTRLSELAAALRLIPLRVREHRDLARRLGASPIERVSTELSLRDRALDESECP